MQLSQTEEKVMRLLWDRKKAHMKDLLNDFPDPKPAKTTVATLLKRMTDKGFIGYEMEGSVRTYYPLIEKEKYSSNHVNRLVKNFFNNSAAQLASYCTTESDMSTEELEDLKKIIEEQLKKKKG